MQQTPTALQPPNPSLTIRPASANDLNALLGCCWADRSYDVGRWLLSRVLRNQQSGRGTGAVLIDGDGTINGFGQLTVWPRCGEISDLFVQTEYRSLGYGTALIQYMVQEAQAMKGVNCVEIGAAESNPRALALYRRLGFVDERVIYMNLGNNEREPVIYMRLPLP